MFNYRESRYKATKHAYILHVLYVHIHLRYIYPGLFSLFGGHTVSCPGEQQHDKSSEVFN